MFSKKGGGRKLTTRCGASESHGKFPSWSGGFQALMVYREGKAAGVLGDPDPARYVGKPLRSCLEDGLPGLVSVVRITSIGRGTTPVRGLTITMVANYLLNGMIPKCWKTNGWTLKMMVFNRTCLLFFG